MMQFPTFQEPVTGNDIVVGAKNDGMSVDIQRETVQPLTCPYKYEYSTPLMPMSSHFLQNPDSTTKNIKFPFLANIFHQGIEHLDSQPGKCDKCGAYKLVGTCPICNPDENRISFCSYDSEENIPIFLIVLIGNPPDDFYSSLIGFPYPVVLASYDKHLIFVTKHGEKYTHMHLFDSEIPPNTILENINSLIPPFPEAKIHKSDFNQILEQITTSIPSFDRPVHIVFFSFTLPHTCIDSFNIPNTTFSVCSSNTLKCNCCDKVYSSGGVYLPFAHTLNIPYLTNCLSTRLQTHTQLFENNDPFLVLPFHNVIFDYLTCGTSDPLTPIQVVIRTSNKLFCFNISLRSQIGFHQFLSNVSFPCFLIAMQTQSPTFPEVMQKYSQTIESLSIPYNLKYHLLFPEVLFKRTIPNILSNRPFCIQIQPTYRIPEFITSSLLSTVTILIMLYNNTIFIWTGNEVKRDTWQQQFAAQPKPGMVSFELEDPPEDFSSETWNSIRALRALYAPIRIPVVVVPGESGRRVHMIEMMEIDFKNGTNLIYQRYRDIASTTVPPK